MRSFLSLATVLFLCLSFTQDVAQKKFHELPIRGGVHSSWIEVTTDPFDTIFATRSDDDNVGIEVEELEKVSSYDFSKLTNLETMNIYPRLSLDSSDAAKKVYTDKVRLLMENSSSFSKCPKLKRIIFVIAEQLYLPALECAPKNWWEEKRGPRLVTRLSHENQRAAWKSFGEVVQGKLPGIKLYSVTERW